MSLKTRLSQNASILLVPGVHDGLTASMAETAGAEAVYLSGAGVAYSRFGRPDIGLVSMSEMADTVAIVRDRISAPMLVDGDTGFGNALNLQRTVRVFERMGANAIQLEDQTFPKRCGHLAGKLVISQESMVGKLQAALDARTSDETLIIARTDAVAVVGFQRAIERARAYADTGVDVIFIDALQSEDQMHEAVAALPDVVLMANMVEGGRTPMMTADELQKIGFGIVIFPGGIVRAQAQTAREYYLSLLSHGTNEPFANRMLDFNGLNEILGTEEMLDTGKRYDSGP